MPDAARAGSGIPRTDPGGRVTLRFWHRLNRFRHFCNGSLALASLDHACRNLVPAFPQRSPPRLLTAAACGGLRSAPDCRTRRALLHLSYSCASPVLTAMLVTHDAMADWLAYGLEDAYAEQPDMGVIRKAKNTSGLIKYQPRGDPADWTAAAKGILATEHPDAIVVMLGLDDRVAIHEPPTEKSDSTSSDKKTDK